MGPPAGGFTTYRLDDTMTCPYLMGTNSGDTMARRGNRRQRDTNDIATPVLDRPEVRQFTSLEDLLSLIPERSLLQEVEDRREYHPARHPVDGPPTRALRLEDARLTTAFTDSGRAQRSFLNPSRVPVCERRSRRREVLFAKRYTGAGARKRRRRYNANSFVKC